MPKPLIWSEWQDAIVRKIYSTQSFAQRRALIKTHLPKLGRTKQQAYHRALQLGCMQAITRQGDWSEAEDEILEKHAHKDVRAIQALLKRHGYSRTLVAIQLRRKRELGGYRLAKVDAGVYSANQAGEIIGASSRCITRHIEAGRLKAKRGANHGPYVVFEIQASDLLRPAAHRQGQRAECGLGHLRGTGAQALWARFQRERAGEGGAESGGGDTAAISARLPSPTTPTSCLSMRSCAPSAARMICH